MSKDVVIIAPCFNENTVIVEFLTSLELAVNEIDLTFEVVMVNDASYDNTLSYLRDFAFRNEKISLTILNLEFNQGHQPGLLQSIVLLPQDHLDHRCP